MKPRSFGGGGWPGGAPTYSGAVASPWSRAKPHPDPPVPLPRAWAVRSRRSPEPNRLPKPRTAPSWGNARNRVVRPLAKETITKHAEKSPGYSTLALGAFRETFRPARAGRADRTTGPACRDTIDRSATGTRVSSPKKTPYRRGPSRERYPRAISAGPDAKLAPRPSTVAESSPTMQNTRRLHCS